MPFKKGYIMPKEWKEKISKAHKGTKLSEEHRKKLSNSWNYDKHFTEEIKRKLSESHKGKKPAHNFNLETRKKMSLAKKGKPTWNKGLQLPPLSEETKRKMSQSHIGKKKPYGFGYGRMGGMLGKNQTEESIQKINSYWTKEKRLEASKRRAKQILPLKDTKIEIKIQYFLEQLGIEFFTHKYIKEIKHGYQCDIFIPSKNLVIECDGNYWHKYPVGNEIDHIRTSELIEKGFKVLRLWEFEIQSMDLNKFVGVLYKKGA